mgnify:CR=1 FL=1
MPPTRVKAIEAALGTEFQAKHAAGKKANQPQATNKNEQLNKQTKTTTNTKKYYENKLKKEVVY